jgi:hypothetical protein
MENENHATRADDNPETIPVSRGAHLRARGASGAKFAFYIHLSPYIVINLLLLLINAMTTPLFWWVQWSLLGWGFGILIHALVSFLLPDLFGVRRRMYQKELGRQINK